MHVYCVSFKVLLLDIFGGFIMVADSASHTKPKEVVAMLKAVATAFGWYAYKD